MKIKFLLKMLIGFGYGGISIFIYMTIFKVAELSISELWWDTLAFMSIGLYYSFSSLIYEYEQWSLLKRTICHFLLSLIVVYPIVVSIGWLPFRIGPILSSFTLFVLIYAGFWYGHILYYRKIIKDLNNSIK